LEGKKKAKVNCLGNVQNTRECNYLFWSTEEKQQLKNTHTDNNIQRDEEMKKLIQDLCIK